MVALDQRSLGGLWSAEGYRREIDSPNSCLLMLEHRSQPIEPQHIEPPRAELSTASMAALKISPGSEPEPKPELEDAASPPAHRLGEDSADASTVLGLGCYWAILDEAHITVLAIDPRYQRRGLGKWLLVNLLQDACGERHLAAEGRPALTRATLEVRPSNSRALALYESFGFETLGRRRRYYADGEDALILWQNSLKTAEFRDRLRQQHGATCHRLKRQGWQLHNENLSLNRT
nr:GNAT family N-acetyltransferase [Nodosilinea sp. TSF1-S3]